MRTERDANRALVETVAEREALRAKFSGARPAPIRTRPGLLARLLRLLRR